MKHGNLALDNTDDRNELHRLLERLPPLRRVQFLAWACRQATLKGSATRPGVQARMWRWAEEAGNDAALDRRLSLEVYFDLWALAMSYEFDLVKAVEKLVEVVRKGGRSWGNSTPIGPRVTAAVSQ